MRKIRALPKAVVLAVRYGYRWYKVDISCQEGKFEKALEILEKTTRHGPVKGKLNLKKAQVLYELSRYQECLQTLNAIVPVLETDGRLTEAEKKYCTAYIYWVILKIKAITGADQQDTPAHAADMPCRLWYCSSNPL